MQANKKNTVALLIGLSATIWLIIALVGYYYTHKPFTVNFIIGALLTFWRLLIMGVIISISGGLGSWILSSRTTFSPLTSIAIQTTLGSGVLGLVVGIMGMIVGFHVLYFIILLLSSSL